MNAQSKIETLASAMAAAFAEIEAATKSANNPHFKSKYADLGAVIDAIKPALIKHNLFFTQHPEPTENGVCIETMLHHSGGEQMSLGKLFVPADKQNAHGFGSALTYARRYGLQTGFGVPAEDDDGNAAVRNNASDSAEPKIAGIHKIKERLRLLQTAGNAADTLDIFNALVSSNADDLTKIKEAAHGWWTGDGEDFEGFKSWIVRRRDELSRENDGQFDMLVASLKECGTIQAMTNWMSANESIIEQLDGAESRHFEAQYNAHEAAVLAAATVNAG